jgi:hypothetical protein
MRVNPNYIQLISDLLIPILGFVFWEWGLYFILLFILFDALTVEVFQHVKSYKILQFTKGNPINWLRLGTLSGLSFLTFLVVLHIALWRTIPAIDFYAELWKFWSYEDIGIQQGYLLLPILLFAGYTNYKHTFLLTRKAETMTLNQLWIPSIKHHTIRIGACAIWFATASFVTLPLTFWVVLVLLSTAGFRWFTMSGRMQ